MLMAAAVLATAPAARSNGRFPSAQYVVAGPGAASDVIVLRATFGLVVSRDGGATFHWLCEETLQYSGVWDAPVAISADGALHVGLTDGLLQTPDGCTYVRNASLEGTLVQDLSADPAGETILGIESSVGSANHVLVSHDRGVTFARAGAGLTGTLPSSVEAAPSRATRVYVTTGDQVTLAPHLFHSNDEGTTLIDGPHDVGGATELYVAAVDPLQADRVWVRGVLASGTALLRSDDGGLTLAPIAHTTGAMLGFAISEDGMHVWYGGPDDGLFRSDDGGAVFTHVATTHVTCLRHHAGVLYVCADWLREPFALARWTDGAASMQPLLRFEDIAGAVTCDPGTTEHDTCGARWPAMRSMFTMRADAGLPRDASVDAAVDAPVASDADLDAGDSNDHGGSCRCGAAPGARGRASAWTAALVTAFAWAAGRRRAATR